MEDAGRSKAPIPVLSANTHKRGTVPVEMGGRNYGHAETYLTAYGARHDSMCWCSVLEGSRSSDEGKTPNLCGRSYGHEETYLTAYGARDDSMPGTMIKNSLA
ncbi:hypothetical protein CDAR_260791 [Caerostris darwini]|uniref:Uncharacterized protein n=1 Tax=Caerostris darwini TaxID=1538125 RepID=A0AAV4S7E5_9ARAC|nr:hypothetical protein CDAR_260791 [Caerostris darwini]